MKFNYFVVILLALQWIAGVSTGIGPPSVCCHATSKERVNITIIKNYTQETTLCFLQAVRFLLKSGKVLCSDPKDAWAKHAIKKLNSRLSTKAPNTPLSSTSTTTHIFSLGTTTESTVTMTIPKGTLTTWKPTSFIQSFSTKRPLKNTNKPPQQTSIQTIKMTTSTDNMPLITDFEMTSMTTLTTTKSPTMLVGTSITWKPTTYITHEASAKELSRNSRKPPHSMTTRQITSTEKRKTVTPVTMTTSMTKMTKNRVTMTTPEGTSITWKPARYITDGALLKELPKNTTNLPYWITTRQTVTTKERKTFTPKMKTASMTTTTEYRENLTTPKETSTTQRPVQKTSTTNVTTQTTRWPPFGKNKLEKNKVNKSPWTVLRLKKKRKQGLRRVQMSTG